MKSLAGVGSSLSLSLTLVLTPAFSPKPGDKPHVVATPGIIRIDVEQAKVRERAQDKYRNVMPASSTSQWMGERPNRSGRERLTTNSLTARTVTKAWRRFGYQNSVRTTNTWQANGVTKFAVGQLRSPKILSNNRVAVILTTDTTLPKRINHAALNIERAQRNTRSFPFYANVDLTSTLSTQTKLPMAYKAQVNFSCESTIVYMATLTHCAPTVFSTVLATWSPSGCRTERDLLAPESLADMVINAVVVDDRPKPVAPWRCQ